jgi:Na+/H+ antiporter NhaD/arsenite permease-like protein
MPVEFILFGLTLLGVALLHHHTFHVAISGLAVITGYKLLFTGFKSGTGLAGLVTHLGQEWVTLTNLFLLLMGFALLARHFENSLVPDLMPALLPHDWKGAFLLLVVVFVLSSFLDNIAAALIGGAMANKLFSGRIHIGYVAAIVAASNAGGCGSVVGDTTSTMMWIDGINPASLFRSYMAAVIALIVCGVPAALQQQHYSPILKYSIPSARVDWPRVLIVTTILVIPIVANIWAGIRLPWLIEALPMIGMGVWAAILMTALIRQPDWQLLSTNLSGTLFLIALVLCASMMPIERLPPATWLTSLSLGFVSAAFDNIPLTALAIKQGGYDWGMLAYAVGFGGSIMWFGSSAGVAIANLFPDSRRAVRWLVCGWHVTVAYVIGFFLMLAVLGWQTDPPHKRRVGFNVQQEFVLALSAVADRGANQMRPRHVSSVSTRSTSAPGGSSPAGNTISARSGVS